MLDFKYLGWQGLRDCGRKSNKFIWWRDIKKVCGREDDIWFDEMVEWKIRDGSHTRFWKDRWSGSVSERLQHKFVRLFHNSKQKEECVEKMDTWRNGRWVLEFRWRREWFQWEDQLVEEFFALVNNVNIEGLGEDNWIWTFNPSYNFTLKSTYITLQKLKVGSNEEEVFKRF